MIHNHLDMLLKYSCCYISLYVSVNGRSTYVEISHLPVYLTVVVNIFILRKLIVSSS